MDDKGIPALDIYINGINVGFLARNEIGAHVFSYRQPLDESLFVSLTMPVRTQSYLTTHLHPIFQMNLPEGYQLQYLRSQFGRLITDTEIGLLGLVGAHGIGRVQAVPSGQPLPALGEPIDLRKLLTSKDAQDALLNIITKNAPASVSGVMPKALLRSEERILLKTNDWIIKTSNGAYPGITQNEYFCLIAARSAGMDVPEITLSQDKRVLALKRFDVSDSVKLGFEDMAVLQGLGTAEKYSGTWERILRSVDDYFPSEAKQSARQNLFKMLAFNFAIRNDDAHLKNFGVIYSGYSDVRVAPAYDVVTTLAYDEFKNNLPALSIFGKKTWTPGLLLWRFGRQFCLLSPKEIRTTLQEIATALTQTSELVAASSNEDQEFHEVGKRMVNLWAEGVGSLSEDKTVIPSPEILAVADRHRLSKPKTSPRKQNPYVPVGGAFSNKER